MQACSFTGQVVSNFGGHKFVHKQSVSYTTQFKIRKFRGSHNNKKALVSVGRRGSIDSANFSSYQTVRVVVDKYFVGTFACWLCRSCHMTLELNKTSKFCFGFAVLPNRTDDKRDEMWLLFCCFFLFICLFAFHQQSIRKLFDFENFVSGKHPAQMKSL